MTRLPAQLTYAKVQPQLPQTVGWGGARLLGARQGTGGLRPYGEVKADPVFMVCFDGQNHLRATGDEKGMQALLALMTAQQLG